ncbi:uncharacterized protein LOC109727884 [Ananas comosus]|uniref:Uncharacterized protein LOC109727884 n=2 Tax=Ananas comosus TaxID=4615 RepID=A0A199VIH2_ANACO|nr:uncharacterized protein LOC109727884 [Ananas comosus]OAY76676.1 hypothetical protein ACMD2_05551 [Ananas comosus]
MKNKASTFLKQIVTLITAVVKARTMAVKNKTAALKTRLMILGFLRNKKVMMSTISHKIHALMSQDKVRLSGPTNENNNKAIVLRNSSIDERKADYEELKFVDYIEEDDDDDYDSPDLTHSLFDLDDEDEEDYGLVESTGSVIELVRNSRQEFNLEDEIDHVADMFIRKIHKQMRLQKQDSLKSYQDMLDRSI